ncbi:hypothetical protein I4U23_017158 [Adineta vaga]|nr:hypothetical protein I4U23_017158 [Adineta vaga]
MAHSHRPNPSKRTIDLIELSSSSDDNDNAHCLNAAAAAAAATTTTHSTTSMINANPSPIGLAQPSYQPFTLEACNQERLTILPIYPPSDQISNQHINVVVDDDMAFDSESDRTVFLLLSSVPVQHLSEKEVARRHPDKIVCSIPIEKPSTITASHLADFYHKYYGPDIMERFNIGFTLLDYSYSRLKKVIQLCENAYVRILQEFRSSNIILTLNDSEFKQLIEFYLQIDVDLFYMKTCSFRQAQPRSQTEGIFCSEMPECRYVMKRCNQIACEICSSCSPRKKQQKYDVQFNSYQKHRFVNGYESILNCPATCNTKNIIYTLTCHCGEYDFIGETSGLLWQRLATHHAITHRLIIEQLMGSANYEKCFGKRTLNMTKKDSCRLYQHPKRCSSAIQSFLDVNDSYWIFVPVSNALAHQANQQYQLGTTEHQKYDKHIQQLVNNVPPPTQGFKFTKQQLHQQYEFFQYKLHENFNDIRYNVYTATMIAVLPSNSSETFRQIVHSLFVTHTEAKLNKLGHIFKYPLRTPVNQGVWCENLCHPQDN